MAKAGMVGKRSKQETESVESERKKFRSRQNDRQPRQVEDSTDSEEEPAHSMSTRYLSAANQSTNRTHAIATKFSTTVDNGKRRLYDLLAECALQLAEEDQELQRSMFTILSQNYLSGVRKSTAMPSSMFKNTTIAKLPRSTVYNGSRSSINLSRKLLARYERSCHQIASVEDVLRIEPGSESEHRILQRAIGHQGDKVTFEVQQRLHGSRKLAKQHSGGDASTWDDKVWSRLAITEAPRDKGKDEGGLETRWATIAKQMQRGVQGIVKHLPEDNE